MFLGRINGRYFALLVVLSSQIAHLQLVRVLRVLTQRISEVVGSDRLLSHCILLLEYLFLLFDLPEPGMLQSLRSCNTVIRIIYQQFHY